MGSGTPPLSPGSKPGARTGWDRGPHGRVSRFGVSQAVDRAGCVRLALGRGRRTRSDHCQAVTGGMDSMGHLQPLVSCFRRSRSTRGLVLLLHEGMHGMLFSSRFWNRWVSVLLVTTFLMSLSAYQAMHLRHHTLPGRSTRSRRLRQLHDPAAAPLDDALSARSSVLSVSVVDPWYCQ